MKKTILSAMLLLSVSCLLGTQGRASECPKERPFLIKEWKNENCPEFKAIDQLIKLESFKFPKWIEIPDYQYNPDKDNPDLLPKLEKIREKISDMQRRQKTLIKTIQKENLKIEEENQKVQEKNKFFKTKQESIDKYYSKCDLGGINPILLGGANDIGFFSWNVDTSDLESYLETAEHALLYNTEETERIKKENSYIKDRNIDFFFDNMKWEYKNNLTISEFEKFYTPEKEKQLLEEYKHAVSKNCAGCDYPKPLSLHKDYCNKKCPNREYVDGKCVLKQDSKKKGK